MTPNGAVLVTGASTGIGYACAQVLAERGWHVFAGVRSDADAQRLNAVHPQIQAVQLDVTSAQQIAAAIETIEQSAHRLQALVNNAGIAVAGPLEYVSLAHVKRQFDINVFGSLAVTQAALPLLRTARCGRIVFMSSVSGQIAPPFVGPYAASKFALEAMADALRMELAPFGITVSVVQPGNVRTPIWQKGRDAKDDLISSMPAVALTHYGAAVDALVRATEREERTGIDARVVAQVVHEALTSPSAKARYPVGNPPAWQRRLARLLPEHMRDRMILRTVMR